MRSGGSKNNVSFLCFIAVSKCCVCARHKMRRVYVEQNAEQWKKKEEKSHRNARENEIATRRKWAKRAKKIRQKKNCRQQLIIFFPFLIFSLCFRRFGDSTFRFRLRCNSFSAETMTKRTKTEEKRITDCQTNSLKENYDAKFITSRHFHIVSPNSFRLVARSFAISFIYLSFFIVMWIFLWDFLL